LAEFLIVKPFILITIIKVDNLAAVILPIRMTALIQKELVQISTIKYIPGTSIDSVKACEWSEA